MAKEEEARKAAQEGASGEDNWEVRNFGRASKELADMQDYPADEEGVDTEKPDEALKVALKLKDIGTT